MSVFEAQDAQQRSAPGCLIVVCGLPGTGKTTEAKRLAARRRAVRLDADDWMAALSVSLWDETMRSRVESLQWEVAQDLLRVGATVIIEWGTWGRDERGALREGAKRLGASVELHYLHAPVDELWRRIQCRGREDPPITQRDVEQWSRAFEAPDEAEMRLYDFSTSSMAP